MTGWLCPGQVPRQCVKEARVPQERDELDSQIGAQVIRGASHFLQQLGTAIDHRNHIFQVVAGKIIASTPTLECFELCRQKERCRGSGRNNRAAESRSCRLVSPMDYRPKATDHHLLGQFAFARTPVPEGVGQGQQFIEDRIAEGSLGRLLV